MDDKNPLAPSNTPGSETKAEPGPQPEVQSEPKTESQLTGQADVQPEAQTTEQPAAQSIAQQPEQPTSQPVAQPVEQPSSQPVAQPVSETAPKKKKTGLIISLCVGGFLIIATVIILLIIFVFSSSPVVGRWDCYSVFGAISNQEFSGEPDVKLILEKNGSFTFGPYTDLEKNHIIGHSYSVTSEDKSSSDGFDKFYMIKFGQPDEFVVSGEKMDLNDTSQLEDSKMKLEMAIKEGDKKKEALLAFSSDHSMFYCYSNK